MKKLVGLVKIMTVVLFVCGMVSPSWAGIKMEIDEQTKGEVGILMQTWFQYVEDGKNGDEKLNDFIIRRAYMYLKGDVTDLVSFFTHIASDRVGQDGLPATDAQRDVALGGGVAWRDLWITLNLHEALKIQMGRMYIPLTRNYMHFIDIF